jgi:hypothetical protein
VLRVTNGVQDLEQVYLRHAGRLSGEDQVNVEPLLASLAGSGSVKIVLTADGQAANTVKVTIQ